MPIAREGYPFIGGGILFALAVHWVFGTAWAIPAWAAALFVVQFFRDPIRTVPMAGDVVVSPADGRIVAAKSSVDPVTGGQAQQIAIFLNVFSVHANRIPVAGSISRRKYCAGKFFNASLDKASQDNERNIVCISTADSKNVTCIQIAGLIARRILCYVDVGDEVHAGQRYGFIRFGSRVELFLPESYHLQVNVGDKVKGGRDVVAKVR